MVIAPMKERQGVLATQLYITCLYQLLKFTAGVRITSSLTVEWVEQQRFVATTILRILHSHETLLFSFDRVKP